MGVKISRYPYQCRIWPNGEFGLSSKPKNRRSPPKLVDEFAQGFIGYSLTFSDCNHNFRLWCQAMGGWRSQWQRLVPGYLEEVTRECLGGDSPLGLAVASKNHKRLARGSKGLTGLGRRMIRNGCFLLQRRLGKRNLALCTLTLPPLTAEQWRLVSLSWSEILRVFLQWFHRRLSAGRGTPWVIGCVEIQEKRQINFGGFPLHAHFVYHARQGGAWLIPVEDMTEAWERAVRGCVELPKGLYFGSAVDVKTIKKDCAAYLSKYMSKGVKNPDEMKAQGYKIPSSWWFAVGTLKSYIKHLVITSGGELAAQLHDLVSKCPNSFRYINGVFVDRITVSEQGVKKSNPYQVAWYGLLGAGHREYLELFRQSDSEGLKLFD